MSAAPVTARVAAEVAQLADEDLIAMLDRVHAIEESLHETQRRLAGVVNVPVRYLGELGDALLVERVAVARAQAVARAYLNAIDGELLTRPLRDNEEAEEHDEAEQDDRPTEPPAGGPDLSVEDRVEEAFCSLIDVYRAGEAAQRALVLQAMRAVVRCSPRPRWEKLRHQLVRDVPYEWESLWSGVAADLGPAGGAP